MVRVLHLVGNMSCEGTQNMIMNLYRKINREKVQFDFLVNTSKKCFFDDEIEELGGKIFYIDKWKASNTVKYIRKLSDFLSEHDEYDILHSHIASSSAINLLVAKKRGLYGIAHSHSTKGAGGLLKDFHVKLGSFPIRFCADHFFACSAKAGEVRFGKKIIKSKKFDLLPNAINIEKYKTTSETCEQIKKHYNLNDKFVVGHIGRFDPVKNHMFLLSIFEEILKLNRDSVLILVGGGGESYEPLKERIKKSGLEDKIIFTGVTPDVSKYLQVMDCFVFPSISEGLGIVAIEAECFGMPCFINETLPCELYINDNVYGISLNKTSEEWAKIILEKSNMKVSENIAKENVKNAGYDINLTAKILEDFYVTHSK